MRMVKISLTLVAMAAAIAAAQEVKMQKPESFHHAGISLAVPEEFRQQQPEDRFDVFRTVLLVGNEAVMAVSLSAFPAGKEDTADNFADATIADLRKNLAIRHFKVLKRTQLRVAGINGSARLVSFTFRGQETIATQVFFVRDVKSPSQPVRLCYVLTLEGAPAQRARVLTIFGEVVKSISLIPVRRPVLIGVGELSEPVKVFRKGFSIRPPRGWYVYVTETGMDMGQADYLAGGQPLPYVRVNVTDPQTFKSAKECCMAHLAFARKKAEGMNVETKVLSEGPMQLGGVKGYQLVIEQTPRKEKGPVVSGIIMERTVCIRKGSSPPRSFSLLLVGEGGKGRVKAYRKIFEKIAGSFTFLEPASGPATRPATTPAATTPTGEK